MRIVVDLNRCQGYARCVPLASDVLKLLGEEALAYHPNPRRFAAPTSIARGGVAPGAGDRGRVTMIASVQRYLTADVDEPGLPASYRP